MRSNNRQITTVAHNGNTQIYIILLLLQNKHIHRLCDYILQYSKIHVFNSTTIFIPVQIYKFQYKNKSFGTEKYFLKNLEKTGRFFIYDYYYVPKYICLL